MMGDGYMGYKPNNPMYGMMPPQGVDGQIPGMQQQIGGGQDLSQGGQAAFVNGTSVVKKRTGNLIRLTESQVEELNMVFLNEQLTDNEVLYQI